MDTIVFTPLERVESRFSQYEFPPEGISQLGYTVRRMHKTSMLNDVELALSQRAHQSSLKQLTTYALASASSYGNVSYEPQVDQLGASITEQDPDTGAIVTATLMSLDPYEYYSFAVKMDSGSFFSGTESRDESNYSFRGFTMPASVSYEFVSADETYHARLTGTMYREVVPRIVGPWHIRTTGELIMQDNFGHRGVARLERDSKTMIKIEDGFHEIEHEFSLV